MQYLDNQFKKYMKKSQQRWKKSKEKRNVYKSYTTLLMCQPKGVEFVSKKLKNTQELIHWKI